MKDEVSHVVPQLARPNRVVEWRDLLAVVLLAQTVYLAFLTPGGASSGAWPWVEQAYLLVCGTLVLIALADELPIQNIAALAAIFAAVFGGGYWLGGRLLGVDQPSALAVQPPPMALLSVNLVVCWLSIVLSSRGLARLLLKGRQHRPNYGYWLLGLTVALSLFLAASQDHFALRTLVWPSLPGSSWQGTGLRVLALRVVCCLVALLLATPYLIDKRGTTASDKHYLAFSASVWLSLVAVGIATTP